MAANTIKVTCVDCGAGHELRKGELVTRSKAHCPSCGSTFLEPATDKGRKSMASIVLAPRRPQIIEGCHMTQFHSHKKTCRRSHKRRVR